MEPNELQNLTKKERKEVRREERQNEKETTYKNRKIKRFLKWTVWIVIIAAILYGLVWATAKSVPKEMGQEYPNQGQEHIAVGATHITYNSNPPTSGPHYAQPAGWGVYQQNELPDEQLIHNLEHGGIWISYSKDVATDTIQKIEDLAKRYPNKIVVEPRSKDDAKIVLASWQHLLKLDAFDETTILNFIKSNKNRSPEPNAQ
jgi:Protein of unknown function (DUF3105)